MKLNMKKTILVTSADIPNMREMRTQEYLNNISWMKENLIDEKVIFIETIAEKGSYIEDFYPVFYSKCHVPYFQNKGANLGLSLKSYFQNNEVDEEELVVQTTGRYHFINRNFFDIIDSNENYDFYGTERPNEFQYFTGCFALRSKYFKRWVLSTNWYELNEKSINFEKSLYNFVMDNRIKYYHMEKIHMDCNIFGHGEPSRHIM